MTSFRLGYRTRISEGNTVCGSNRAFEKNNNDQGKNWPRSFEFLGVKFKSYRAQNKKSGNIFTGFGPMDLSQKSTQRILDVLRSKNLARRTSGTLADISAELHLHLQGGIDSYYDASVCGFSVTFSVPE
jgi:hypothetical protein